VIGVINLVLVDLGVLNELDKVSPGVVGGSENVENGIGVGGGVRNCTCGTGVVGLGVGVRGIERGAKYGVDFLGGVEGGGDLIRDLAKRGRDDALNGMLLLRETLHPDGEFGLVLQQSGWVCIVTLNVKVRVE
jgi:hypothetical protein